LYIPLNPYNFSAAKRCLNNFNAAFKVDGCHVMLSKIGGFFLKQLTSRYSKNKNKNEKMIKLRVNTGQVMLSEEIHYY